MNDTIVDLEGDDALPPGRDRGRATLLAFAMCLAVGSAAVGRDGPEALAPVEHTPELAAPAERPHILIADGTTPFWGRPPFATTNLVGSVGPSGALVLNGRTVLVSITTNRGARYWLSSDGFDVVEVEAPSE